MRKWSRHIGLMLALGMLLVASPAAAKRVVFYDPDANHQAILSITAWFSNFLKSVDGDLSFQPVQEQAAFQKLLADKDTVFAIVSSAVLKNAKVGDRLMPLMVPASNGDVYYRKLLLDKGTGKPKELSGKSIAATVPAKQAKDASRTVLTQLRRGGVRVNGALVISVSKDIDALLALTFGQVQAALVTPSSVEVLKRINPAAVASFRTVYETPKILRSPLCAVRNNTASEDRDKILSALKRMYQDENGRKAMTTLGFNAWISYEPWMLENG